MERIGRSVYINLDKRTDRRAQIEAELAHMNVHGERFPAIYVPTYGGVGCAMSHAAVVRQAAEDKVTSLLVLEDDFYWTVPDRATLDARLVATWDSVPDYDVILFDYSIVQGTSVNTYVGRALEASSAAGYLVSGHYLERLAACLEGGAALYQQNPHASWVYINDQYWKRLQSTDRWYYLTPRLGTQRDGYSDLSQRMVKHSYVPQ